MMATNQLKYKKMMINKQLSDIDNNNQLPQNPSLPSLNIGEPEMTPQNYQYSSRFNARKPSLPSIVEFDEKSQNKQNIPKKKVDLESFPQPRNTSEREAGLVVIKYNTQLLIQPKWMEERGTMCLTELWSMKQRKEFCSLDTKRYNPVSHIFGETTNSFHNGNNPQKNKQISHGHANYSSMMPHESKTVLDAKRFKMLPADKQGISYFRPEKMMQQADLFSQLKAEKQGMIITPQSTSSIVQNTFVNKLPLDLMYQQDSQPSSPSRRYQTGNSPPHSKQASPAAKNSRYNNNSQYNDGIKTNDHSPASKSFLKLSPQRQFSTTTSTPFLSSRSHANSFYKTSTSTQQSLKNNQNSNRMSSIGQAIKLPNSLANLAKRDNASDARKQSQQNGLLGQLKEKLLFNTNTQKDISQAARSGGFNGFLKRKNQQSQDQKPFESPFSLIQTNFSPSKTNLSESSEKQLEMNNAINLKAQISLTSLITKCNETLCEGHADQLDIAHEFDDILHEKLSLDKQIERREVKLYLMN